MSQPISTDLKNTGKKNFLSSIAARWRSMNAEPTSSNKQSVRLGDSQ